MTTTPPNLTYAQRASIRHIVRMVDLNSPEIFTRSQVRRALRARIIDRFSYTNLGTKAGVKALVALAEEQMNARFILPPLLSEQEEADVASYNAVKVA